MATACFELVPRDGLFFKDAAGWYTSASGRGRTLPWPWPSTVLGALRGAHGRALERERSRRLAKDQWPQQTKDITLEAVLPLRRPLGEPASADWRLWPAPGDALTKANDGKLIPLVPSRLEVSARAESADALPLHPIPAERGKTRNAAGFWPERQLVSWLASWPPSPPADGGAQPGGPGLALPSRFQTRVSLDPTTLTGREGQLFSHEVLEPLERRDGAWWQWSIAVRTTLHPQRAGDLATLGSDSRLVELRELPEEVFSAPSELIDAFSAGADGVRLLVVTPASFKQGWLPDGFERRDGRIRGHLPALEGELELVAARVARPLAVSGWDMALGRPKDADRTVPPGSVYYFKRLDGRGFGASDAETLWLAGLGGRTDEGFGRVLPGSYHPTKEGS